MPFFVIEYHRAGGVLLYLKEFPSTAHGDAMSEWSRHERNTRTDPDVEVVLLEAESVDALRETHARYFHRTLSELGRAKIPGK